MAGSTSFKEGAADAVAGTSATFALPLSVRADVAGGLLYVADTTTRQVRTIAIAGSHAVATLATLPFNVFDIALNPAARIMYVAVGSSVYVVTYAGVSTLLAGSVTGSGYADGTGSAAQFNWIYGLALDASVDVLYATDNYNHRIRCITTAGGVVTTVAGLGVPAWIDGVGTAAAFHYPWGIAVDAANSALYVADASNNAIRRVQLPIQAPTAPLPWWVPVRVIIGMIIFTVVLATVAAVGACAYCACSRRRAPAAAGAVAAAAADGVEAAAAAGGAVVAGTLEAREAPPPDEEATTLSEKFVLAPAAHTLDGAHPELTIADGVAGSPAGIVDAAGAESNAPEVST